MDQAIYILNSSIFFVIRRNIHFLSTFNNLSNYACNFSLLNNTTSLHFGAWISEDFLQTVFVQNYGLQEYLISNHLYKYTQISGEKIMCRNSASISKLIKRYIKVYLIEHRHYENCHPALKIPKTKWCIII